MIIKIKSIYLQRFYKKTQLTYLFKLLLTNGKFSN